MIGGLGLGMGMGTWRGEGVCGGVGLRVGAGCMAVVVGVLVAILVRWCWCWCWCWRGVSGGEIDRGGLGGGGSRLSPSGYVFPVVGLLIFGLLGRLAGLWYLWW